MGVPGFNTWFYSTGCPKAFVDHGGKRFDHVLVDLASVLHSVFRHGQYMLTILCKVLLMQVLVHSGPVSVTGVAVYYTESEVYKTLLNLTVVVLAARTSSRVHKLLYVELDRILLRFQPRQSVLFAMDGPAPLAKLITQRSDEWIEQPNAL